ncbi:MAG: serine/threonine protein kinase [Myxococcales bacterium]|nr:serine/threonine protein kinase [Myxococcales bacterium]
MLGVAATTHSAAPILGAAQAPAGTADPTRVAELLRQLREHQQEKERIRRALERVSEELREVREGSHRLFETLCQSLLGTTLGGRFEVLQRLGGGGHGVVFHAVDRRTHRDVALKLFRAPEAHRGSPPLDPSSPQLGYLSHPNIVTVLEAGTLPSGLPFLAMELLRGKNLSDVLVSRRALGRPLRVEQVARVAHDVCVGLAEAHRWDVVHRDVKPSNVFLARHRAGVQVKLLDFGLARFVPEPALDGAAIAGTPRYIAPERLEREPYDWRVDVYAVGVLLYELFGVPLAEQGAGGWAAGPMDTPPPLHRLCAEAPRALSEVASQALRRDPAQRPSALELASALAPLMLPPTGSRADLTGLLVGPGARDRELAERTLESLEPSSWGELDTVSWPGASSDAPLHG